MSLPTTTPIKTAILKDGEKLILPAGANIISVAVDGFVSVSSTCDNLPTPEALVCAGFLVVESNSGSSQTPAYEDVTINSITISGVKYELTTPFNVIGGSGNAANLLTSLAGTGIEGLFIGLAAHGFTDAGRGDTTLLEFKIPASLVTNSYMSGSSTTLMTPQVTFYVDFPMKLISEFDADIVALSTCS